MRGANESKELLESSYTIQNYISYNFSINNIITRKTDRHEIQFPEIKEDMGKEYKIIGEVEREPEE